MFPRSVLRWVCNLVCLRLNVFDPQLAVRWAAWPVKREAACCVVRPTCSVYVFFPQRAALGMQPGPFAFRHCLVKSKKGMVLNCIKQEPEKRIIVSLYIAQKQKHLCLYLCMHFPRNVLRWVCNLVCLRLNVFDPQRAALGGMARLNVKQRAALCVQPAPFTCFSRSVLRWACNPVRLRLDIAL